MISTNFLDVTGFFVGVLINLLLIALICFYFKRKIDNLEVSQSEQAKMLFRLLSQESQTASALQQSENSSKNVIVSPEPLNIMNGLDLTTLAPNDGDSEEGGSDSDSDSESDDESISTTNSVTQEDANEKIVEIEYIKKVEDDMSVPSPSPPPSPPPPPPQSPTNDEPSGEDVDEEEPVIQVDEVEVEVEVEDESEIVHDVEAVVEEEPSQDNGGEDFHVKQVVYNDDPINDYEKMTVKEMRAILTERGVHTKSSMSKSEIIALLKEDN